MTASPLFIKIRNILLDAVLIQSEREAFFFDWLRDHFGFEELQSVKVENIEARLRELPVEDALQEINIVEEEFRWCKQVPIDRIRSIRKQ